MFALLRQSEQDLHLREGFFQMLLQEDDWSFVIKIHALIEAAVSQQLAAVLDSRLLTIFQHLELGDIRSGKIIFAEALGLLQKDTCRYIRKLSELRNSLVHDIRKTDFSFKGYFESLDENQKKAFLDWVVSFANEEFRNQWLQNARENPKVPIWLFAIDVVVHSSLSKIKANLERKMMEHAYKIMELQDKASDENIKE
jgi:hypothetical protein